MRATEQIQQVEAPGDRETWDATYLRWAGQAPASLSVPRNQLAQQIRQSKRTIGLAAASAPALLEARLAPPLPEFAKHLEHSGNSEFRRGLYVVLIGLGLAGAWAGFVPLSGAIVASGTVVSASDAKKVQHPTGGVVREILVHDGSEVAAGDVLLRLDPTNARGTMQIAAKRLLEARALIQRLKAERDGLVKPAPAISTVEWTNQPDEEAVRSSQQSLLEAHAKARKQAIAMQKMQVDELKHAIASAQSQLVSKQQEREMVGEELAGVEALFRDKLTTVSRVMALRRNAAELDGAIGSLQASIAETQAKIAEAKLQLDHQLDDVQMKVLTDLREAEDKESDLVEQQRMAGEQLSEIDIRAPQSGIVHDLSVHTVGGVVTPAEVLMLIAPDGDELLVETQVQPKDIDQVTAGQPAMLRFVAFDRNTTPQLQGTVAYVSPDTTRDPRTNAPTYTTRVAISADEISKLGKLRLMAGMPAEVYLTTRSRTALTYLFKPLIDQFARTFRGR